MASSERAPNMLTRALEYVELGYPVFPVCSPLMGQHAHGAQPCSSPGKRPLVSWEPYQRTLPTTAEVQQWWGRWPLANIGMATGVLSGIVVLDCDSGEARQLAMERGGLDKTPAVFTGKPGGVHYWLAHPIDEVRNFASKLPGLDFRGDGGYVLLPPSRHASGAHYRWADNTAGMRAAPVPPWLLEMLRGARAADGGPIGDREAMDYDAILAGADEGGRDDFLFRAACRFRRDDLPRAAAEAMIRQAARACRPPFDEEMAAEKVARAYRIYKPGGAGPTLEFDDAITAEIIGDAPGEEEPKAWQVFNAEDFLAIEFPPIEWRVEGYLRERAIMFSFGAPGSIKTFVATDAALAIASGGLFLNKFTCQQGRVLIVQEDTQASDYQQAYLRPMLAARGLSGSDVRDTLFVAPPADFALDQADRLRDLCQWLEIYKPDMVVLDSFYLMYSGKKEDLLSIIKILKRIRDKYGCAIWIIDHNRKGQGASSAGDDAIDRLINGREKSAACDSVMESRNVKGESGSVFLDLIKCRGAKLPEPVRVSYVDGRITIDGDDETSPKGAAQTVYEWLCREGGSRTKAQIARGCDLSERSVHYAVGELVMSGLARKSGKAGRADLWLAIRKADAEPQRQPTIDFSEGAE